MIFRELSIDIGTGIDLRIPLTTKFGSIYSVESLCKDVGILSPEKVITYISIYDIIEAVNILFYEGIVNTKIKMKSKN